MLKQLMLTRKIGQKKADLEKLKAARAEMDEQRKALQIRETELEAAVNELTENATEEEEAAVNAAISEHEANVAEADKAEAENEQCQIDLQGEIDGLERELNELNERATVQSTPPENAENRKERSQIFMNKFFSLNPEQTRDFFNDDGVVWPACRLRAIDGRDVEEAVVTPVK